MNCKNCGKEALATDEICWHCGAKLPKTAVKAVSAPDPDADLLTQERSKTAVLITAALFALTALALMAVMTALGQRPLFILNGKTERPAGWTAVTNQPQTFTLNLPPDWEWLDKADERMGAIFEEDGGMETAVLPFLAIVPDSKLVFMAQKSSDSPFLLILHGNALAETSPRELITSLNDAPPDVEIVASDIIENSITGQQVDFRLNFPNAGLRCQHRYVQDGYLLIACADEREYGRYTSNLYNLLSSFQPLTN